VKEENKGTEKGRKKRSRVEAIIYECTLKTVLDFVIRKNKRKKGREGGERQIGKEGEEEGGRRGGDDGREKEGKEVEGRQKSLSLLMYLAEVEDGFFRSFCLYLYTFLRQNYRNNKRKERERERERRRIKEIREEKQEKGKIGGEEELGEEGGKEKEINFVFFSDFCLCLRYCKEYISDIDITQFQRVLKRDGKKQSTLPLSS